MRNSDWFVLNRWTGHFIFVEASSPAEAAKVALERFAEFQSHQDLEDAELVVFDGGGGARYHVKTEVKFSI